jgi:hypothetical protein
MSETNSLDHMIEAGKNVLAAMFLETRKTEFEKFAAEKEADGQTAARHKWLLEALETRQAFHAALSKEVVSLETADFAGSIFRGSKNHPAGAIAIQTIASNFVPAFLVKNLSAEILAFSEREVSTANSELETFKRDNAKVLKRLGLL